MNIKNLNLLCDGLNALPYSVRNNNVNMKAIYEPSNKDNPCGSVGCHSYLISLVNVPALQKLYTEKDYLYLLWADTLGKFLGLKDKEGLEKWAYKHPHIWKLNNKGFTSEGVFMFACPGAFNQTNFVFKHQVIIDKWNEVRALCQDKNHTKLNSIILNTILDKIFNKPDVSIKQK